MGFRALAGLGEGGRRVAEVAADLGISEQTIYVWRRQARIDAGLEAGLSTSEQGELAAAKRRIRELEKPDALQTLQRTALLLRGCVGVVRGEEAEASSFTSRSVSSKLRQASVMLWP